MKEQSAGARSTATKIHELGSPDILLEIVLDFPENNIEYQNNTCERYGCTCIQHEKCHGCLLQ